MLTSPLFYILWGVVALFPLICAICLPETIKDKISASFAVLILAGGIVAFIWMGNENQAERWNDGICECGGTYEFSGASKYRTSKYFYYTCDTCGHTKEFSQIMK